MKMLSLFSGIGLLDFGLERAGLARTVCQVEIDPYCRSVLARHWPDADRFDDVRAFHASSADVVCGGFPCQPHSVAGKRRGAGDDRHLWPEYARIIDEATPRIVVIENVPGLRTTELRNVLADLAARGFDAEWVTFSAGSIGAPHRRSRLWIAATQPDRVDVRLQPGWLSRAVGAAQETQSRRDREIMVAHSDSQGRVQQAVRIATLRGWAVYCGWHLGDPASVDDGGTSRLARRSRAAARKALGNAVVVQCAELVGRAIRGAIS